MEEFVARENIRRFEAQLRACADPSERETLARLLEQSRDQLAQVQARKPDPKA